MRIHRGYYLTKGEGLKKLIAAWVVAALSIYFTSLILGGEMDFGGFWPVVATALVVGLMNFILAPLLNLLTCPMLLLTLGLSRFLISGLILLVASSLVDGFEIGGFWWAVLAAVVIAILTPLIEKVLGQSDRSSRHS